MWKKFKKQECGVVDLQPLACWCLWCRKAFLLDWVHGRDGEITVVFPVTQKEWKEGYVMEKRAMPFFVDGDSLVLSDAYPIVEH